MENYLLTVFLNVQPENAKNYFWGSETFCLLLVACCFLLVTRYFLLVTYYSLLVTRYSLLVGFYSLLVTFYSLLFLRYFLLFTSYFCLVTHCYLRITHCYLLGTHYPYSIALYRQCSYHIICQFLKKKMQALMDAFLWWVDIVCYDVDLIVFRLDFHIMTNE